MALNAIIFVTTETTDVVLEKRRSSFRVAGNGRGVQASDFRCFLVNFLPFVLLGSTLR